MAGRACIDRQTIHAPDVDAIVGEMPDTYEMAHRGEISVIRIGRNIRVSRTALQQWIEQRR